MIIPMYPEATWVIGVCGFFFFCELDVFSSFFPPDFEISVIYYVQSTPYRYPNTWRYIYKKKQKKQKKQKQNLIVTFQAWKSIVRLFFYELDVFSSFFSPI